MYRIGNAYDVHRLESGSGIILGGINIKCEYKIISHSDGDVIIHALIDAMLGALSLGDIGTHFPDTDEKYKDIDSTKLLEKIHFIILNKGYDIVNADMTVILEKPKLINHIDKMRKKLSSLLKIDIDRISIKATTNEKIDTIGKGEAIACHAVCLLKSTSCCS